MTIIINHREPSDIYFNGNISEVYYGQHLVWSGCKYKPGQLIINNSSPGTYNWQCLSPGVFEIIAVGGGGGSESVDFDSGRGGNGGAVSTTIIDSEMIKVQTIEWNKAGNTGASKNNGNIDGTSIYQNYGKGGNGGFNHQSAGLAGVVQVKFISKR